MSLESLRSSKDLRDNGYWRSSVSRAYYAAYAAITGSLGTQSFPRGWNNPSHAGLPNQISNEGSLPESVRRKLKRNIRILRNMREDADYRPQRVVGKNEAIDALHNSSEILKLLEAI
ncbi:MAG: HEPN domain-containing protein [Candidatus Omnitrophica bacterium]|nr:HEPN domain-containing protein [Candidatus Omnitrophota bacterium]MCB9767107.1 HEPN domain-containing protein [Candidatus Omnitrophota bacterium]